MEKTTSAAPLSNQPLQRSKPAQIVPELRGSQRLRALVCCPPSGHGFAAERQAVRRTMPRSFWKKKKVAGVVLLGVAYFGLWGVTERLGVPVVRAAASAVAPFVVKANYDWIGGPLLGAAASVHYLWIGRWTKEIWHSAVRVQ
jgi:hypothetical protein